MSAISTSPAVLPFPSVQPNATADVATLYREAVEFYDDNSRAWATRAGYVLSKFGQARDEANTAKMLADSLAERLRALQVENQKLRTAARCALIELGETLADVDAPDVLIGHDPISVTDRPEGMSPGVLLEVVLAINNLRAVS